jgi:hypothetical protein
MHLCVADTDSFLSAWDLAAAQMHEELHAASVCDNGNGKDGHTLHSHFVEVDEHALVPTHPQGKQRARFAFPAQERERKRIIEASFS